ncbi:MAG TPA: tetratricopeptide repeat protein [Terriglobales bacterium]|nr:tetratricopeptide repeat protein [Terriglobales bacterium]
MAFGFGFNKTKVLAAAERYIQQGKLQNAIAEYEKVVKADPKDLTVLNTIGDLYARIGQTDKAVSYFKSVGDTYAAQGFTVKAIAMYKKLTKLKPSVESVLKLAELYGQQGLQNDARAQYLLVAERYLHAGRLDQAVHAFQKILEIDPENSSLQVRLAEVYVRLERKDEARKLLLKSAEALQARGSKAEAEEVLARVLHLYPTDKQALLMRGTLALQAGDPEAAVQTLEQFPDLDQHADGLRSLAMAYLQTGRTADAGPPAKKLFALNQDASALSAYADALMREGQYEEGLRIYQQYAEKLLASNPSVLENLHACLDHIRDNIPALELLRNLYERADDKVRLAEVGELLAHRLEESGDLARARDLYLQLASLDPNSTAYTESYNRLAQQVGAGATAGQPGTLLSIEDLNLSSPDVDQGYNGKLAAEIQKLITETDLFISYNLPAKAIEELETALAKLPNDLRLNQRLAALYVRSERLREAAECCRKVHDIYQKAGFADSAQQYGEMAKNYAQRAGEPVAPEVVISAPSEAEPAAAQDEIDISGEWESSLAQPVIESVAKSAGAGEQAEAVAGLVEEIRFYLQHGLWEEAEAAIGKCEAQFPDTPELSGFREQLQARGRKAEAKPQPPAPAPVPVAPAASQGALSDMVSDLESALGDDFGVAPPAPESAPEPVRMAAAAAASGGHSSPASASAGFASAAAAAPALSAQPAQANSELAEIFTEFKEGLEETGGDSQSEDLETHYNLGVAFKEMGLLDESIGELQKVCQAIERGQHFTQVVQAFTWLAHAFLEKGVPQAAIRWYEKALKLPTIDEDTRIALHYELAAAYEACNNKSAALTHFLEVYGANIDYRDVAERIKALKS